MTTQTTGKTELLEAIDDTVFELLASMSSLDESKINTVPYEGSWTAAQLLRHVEKSTDGMAKALSMESKPAERDPGERIPELKRVFLDFTHPLKSPDFIVPEDRIYVKTESLEELKESFELFKKNATGANLNELVEGLPLGPITKLEMLHFVLYHTQRHLHQLKKIVAALSK